MNEASSEAAFHSCSGGVKGFPRKRSILFCLAAVVWVTGYAYYTSNTDERYKLETPTGSSQNKTLKEAAVATRSVVAFGRRDKPTPPTPTYTNEAKKSKTIAPLSDKIEAGSGTTTTRSSTILKHANRTERIVVSMKTMPGRIAYIQPTLDSLLFQQTAPIDRFYLVLPYQPSFRASSKMEHATPTTTNKTLRIQRDDDEYVIPAFVQEYADAGHLSILRPDYDYGAIDKIIHTLPVEEAIFQRQQTESVSSGLTTIPLSADQFCILYLDDDMIYDTRLVEILSNKSHQYPEAVVALSGAPLRSNFRKIAHSNPAKMNKHPFLYYYLGGIDSSGDRKVDIVQGFMGVLVRLSFFNVSEFVHLGSNKSVPEGVRRSDDFVICGYLERRGVPRRVVDGGLIPVVNPTPSKIGNLGSTMHMTAMIATSYLQTKWGIWSNYSFVPYESLSDEIRTLIECENDRLEQCPVSLQLSAERSSGGMTLPAKATIFIDRLLNISNLPGA